MARQRRLRLLRQWRLRRRPGNQARAPARQSPCPRKCPARTGHTAQAPGARRPIVFQRPRRPAAPRYRREHARPAAAAAAECTVGPDPVRHDCAWAGGSGTHPGARAHVQRTFNAPRAAAAAAAAAAAVAWRVGGAWPTVPATRRGRPPRESPPCHGQSGPRRQPHLYPRPSQPRTPPLWRRAHACGATSAPRGVSGPVGREKYRTVRRKKAKLIYARSFVGKSTHDAHNLRYCSAHITCQSIVP